MKKKIAGILFILLGIISALCFEKFYVGRPFSIDRMMIYLFVIVFISLHIIFNIKKLWDFIYRKRFIIGIILFIYVVGMGYNGSSIYVYNDVIEPSFKTREAVPIWGNARTIRSDEFLVDTPGLLSQYNHNKNFGTINNALMGRDTIITLYPQLPTKTFSILTNVRLLGFLFLDIEQAFAYYWYLPYFLMFFGLFELFMIMTKKNKMISLLGTMMLVFSPSMLWWNSTPFLVYGSLAFVFFYNLLKTEKKWQKVLFASLLGLAGANYVMILYPAWQLVYGYLFLILFIYAIIENRNKIKATDFLYLLITIGIMALLLIPNFLNSMSTIEAMLSTEYPGARSSTGGTGWQLYYNYFSSIFYSISDLVNPCEDAQYLSFYPLPILLGIYYIIKNRKEKEKNYLLIFLTAFAFGLSIWNYIPIGFLAKITLLSISTPERAQLIANIACIMIIVLLLNEYQIEKSNKKKRIISLIISLLFCSFGLWIAKQNVIDYMTTTKIIISFILFTILIYLLLINTKKGNIIFTISLSMLGIFFFATIQPINKGLDAVLEKPFAKEIQKISNEEPDSLWITVTAPLHFQDYILANGARVINSTNYYPNLELWKKFDEEGKYNETYNRYAHIVIDLIEEETNFELLGTDLFRVNVNAKEICKFNVDYIATTTSLEKFNLKNLEKKYQSENVFIYAIDCN